MGFTIINKGFYAGQTKLNQMERDQILFGEELPNYIGGYKSFDNVNAETLQRLFDGKHIDPNDYQNNSPTHQKFLDFIKKYNGYTVGGYAISVDRDDYRLSITDITKKEPFGSEQEKADFIDLFKYADELRICDEDDDNIYAWFD